MAKYEILYIIRPNIEEEAKNALVARFDSILTDNGATVVESKDWENVVLHTKSKISVKDFTTLLTLKQTTMQLLTSSTVFQKSTVTFFVT